MEELPEQQFQGYVYNPKTVQNFNRLKQRGVVLPPFRALANFQSLIQNTHSLLFSEITKILVTQSLQIGINLVSDASFDPKSLVLKLKQALSKLDVTKKQDRKLKTGIARTLADVQKNFFEDQQADAPEWLTTRINFALNKDDVFRGKLEGIKKEYLDSAIERIEKDEDFFKSVFLIEFTDWILGKSDKLNLETIMQKMKQTSVQQSKYFARNQFQLFNKSLTVASYQEAEVERVRWLTVGDGRVRPTHKALNNKIFDIDKIPEEQHDYLCRCALIPIA
jgi:SPP1 gp7 family putative phage head morphogenesis protein